MASDLLSSVVPAAAVLVGVGLGSGLDWWKDRGRWKRERRQRWDDERRRLYSDLIGKLQDAATDCHITYVVIGPPPDDPADTAEWVRQNKATKLAIYKAVTPGRQSA